MCFSIRKFAPAGQSPYENALLMDETVKQTGEECMVVVSGGRVIALTKKMPLAL